MAENLQDMLKKAEKKAEKKEMKMQPENKVQRICPNCGAPTLSEVCQYCGQYVGTATTQELSAEYPTLECKNASLTFWNVLFPMIFCLSFGFFGFIFPLLFRGMDEGEWMVQIISLPFAAISLVAGAIVLIHVIRYVLVMTQGTETTAVVYGYMNDTISYNNAPGQVVKLLLDTPNGKRFIYYKTGRTDKPYAVNHPVRLKIYRNLFRILPEIYER